MKLALLGLIFITNASYGQTYQKFESLSLAQLKLNKERLSSYYESFSELISRRDTAYLRKQLTETKATKIFIIEGFNFETKNYSLFEEYKLDNNVFPKWSDSKLLVDKKIIKHPGSYFLGDADNLYKDKSAVDSIPPRKYRYGGGCIVSDTTYMLFKALREKAEKDGFVIEKYCRVETLIDKRTNRFLVKYCFPVQGKREFESRGVGMMTDWPPGLDFWLFVSPLFVELYRL